MRMRYLSVAIITALALFPLIAEANILGSLAFNSADFSLAQVVERDSSTYTIIKPKGHGAYASPGNPGDPELPAVNFLYSLPHGMEIDKIIVNSYKEVTLSQLTSLVHPIQNPIPDTGQAEFVRPGNVYRQGGIYPTLGQIKACLNPVAYIRGNGIGTIQIRPIRYDVIRNRLLLIKNIGFEITLRPAHLNTIAPERESWLINNETISSLKSIVQNSSDVVLNSPSVEIITDFDPHWNDPLPACIVITNQDLASSWVPYRDWLTAQGRLTQIVTLGYIYYHYQGYDEAEKIRNYLKDRFITDGIGAAIIGGNVNIVPPRFASTGIDPRNPMVLCDLYYADLSGDWDTDGDHNWGEWGHDNFDIGADILVARVPAETPAEVTNWWNKRYRYETNPGNGDPSYLLQTMVASTDQMRDYKWYSDITSPLSELFSVDSTTLKEEPCGQCPEFPTQPSGINVVNAFNSGVHIMEFINHGGLTYSIMRSIGPNGYHEPGWLFDTDMFSQITACKDHITFATSCLLGDIDFNYPPDPIECFAKVDLTSLGGSVAARYNSRSVPVLENTSELDGATLEFIVNNQYSFLSVAHYNAKMCYAPSNLEDCMLITNNNLFGCPVMKVWRALPQNFSANYPSQIGISLRDSSGVPIPSEIVVNINDGRSHSPVRGALVTLWKEGEVYSLANSDSNGIALFNIITDTEGPISLRITKEKYIPLQGSIDVDSTFILGSPTPKVETTLPALIWNPHNLPSGDSINSSLHSAGYEAHLINYLSPYLDSLNNYSLFVMGGIPQEYDSLIEPLEYEPYRAAIDTFLEHGGSMFWEGIWSLTCAIEPTNCNVNIGEDLLLNEYTKAAELGISSVLCSNIKGAPNTYFNNIDSMGYFPGYITPIVGWWRNGISMPLIIAQVDTPALAAVCAYRNSHTMATNFSWARLHDGDVNNRAQLITDIMNWLSSAEGQDDSKPDIPEIFSLSQNYPNPFNVHTTIQYALAKTSQISLYIYDITGRKIKTLEDGYQGAGKHSVIWDTRDNASGIYFYRLKAGSFTETKKMILMK